MAETKEENTQLREELRKTQYDSAAALASGGATDNQSDLYYKEKYQQALYDIQALKQVIRDIDQSYQDPRSMSPSTAQALRPSSTPSGSSSFQPRSVNSTLNNNNNNGDSKQQDEGLSSFHHSSHIQQSWNPTPSPGSDFPSASEFNQNRRPYTVDGSAATIHSSSPFGGQSGSRMNEENANKIGS